MHPAPLARIKSIIQLLEDAFPKAVIQILRPDKGPHVIVAYVANSYGSPAPTVHQIHISVPVKAPGKLCLQWYEESQQGHLWPLCDRVIDNREIRDPNGDAVTFRATKHIMATRWDNDLALQGWIARTRHYIDVNFDRPAWEGLSVEPKPRPAVVLQCWQHGEQATPHISLDRSFGTQGNFILRPGDPDSPVLVY